MTTERDLLDGLWRRLCTPRVPGAAPRYVLAEHVRLNPAWGHSIADAISVDTWGSGGYALDGYEVKVTRSDWRREIRPDTSKSEPWRSLCRRWLIVAPPGVVPRDELPTGWGLIEPSGPVLRLVVRPALLTPAPLQPANIAGLMRAVARTATRHAKE